MKGFNMEQQKGTSEVKRLYRSKVDRIFAGVCGGFAEYFNIDPVIVRVVWLIILIFSGIWTGLFIYLVCMIVMKDNPEQSFTDKKPQSSALYWGIGLVLLGLLWLSNNRDWGWYYFRPFHFHFLRPWLFHWDRFWPIVIILFGIFYLVHVLRKNKESGTNQTNPVTTIHSTGKLYRSRKDKIIGGVCGGLAKNLNIDPVFVRIGWVILTFMIHIFSVIIYIVWMIVVPEEPIEQQQTTVTVHPEENPVKKTTRRVKKLPENKDEKEE
jgi:phage shock protein C